MEAGWTAAAWASLLKRKRATEVIMQVRPAQMFAALVLTVAVLFIPSNVDAGNAGPGQPDGIFHDLRFQTEAFISCYQGIVLTPEELEKRNEALRSFH